MEPQIEQQERRRVEGEEDTDRRRIRITLPSNRRRKGKEIRARPNGLESTFLRLLMSDSLSFFSSLPLLHSHMKYIPHTERERETGSTPRIELRLGSTRHLLISVGTKASSGRTEVARRPAPSPKKTPRERERDETCLIVSGPASSSLTDLRRGELGEERRREEETKGGLCA